MPEFSPLRRDDAVTRKSDSPVTYAIVALLFGGVFALDCVTYLGLAVWILYLAPLLLSLFVWRSTVPVIAGVAAALLVLAGYYLSPPPAADAIHFAAKFNRTLAMLAFVAIGFAGKAFVAARLTLAEREHAKSEERNRLLNLLEQVPAVVNFLRGPDLVFEFAHPTAIATMGGRDVLGKPVREAVPEMLEQPYFERLKEVYATGKTFTQTEVPVWHIVDGEKRETFWSSVYLPVRGERGTIEGVMTFDLDVTDTVRARKALETANRMKDEFLGTLSHELRTPLNAVLGWATILKSSNGDAAQLTRGLDAIERNAKAQERLVADLLDVSRIISGKLELHVSDVDLGAVVNAAVDVVRPAATAKRIVVDIDVREDARVVSADGDRLQQVVWNLLSNAIRFTPVGGRITVTALRQSSRTCIRVHDTGVGIAPEHLSRVFDRFTQVDSSITRAHGGLGLGLAIVRHIVEAHGGEVSVESEGLGLGTTFIVSLPIRAVRVRVPSAAEASTPDVAADRAPEGNAKLDSLRVLVVDDDDDALEVVRVALGQAGASVTTARSARDALAADGPFDVIVSDIGMPDMDGYELMERIRGRIDIPAIALTAYARPEDVARAKRAGYVAHLSKPVEIARLVETVERSVRGAA